MNFQRYLSTKVNPIIDTVLVLLCAAFSPDVVNILAHDPFSFLGWESIPDFSAFYAAPVVTLLAVMATPFILKSTGFYQKNDLQRIGRAVRQILALLIYYLCACALYLSIAPKTAFIGHLVVVNIVMIPLCIFGRFILFRQIKLLYVSKGNLRNIVLVGMSDGKLQEGWESMPGSWRKCLNVVGSVTPDTYDEGKLQSLLEERYVGQIIIIGGIQACLANQAVCSQCELQGIDVYIPMTEKSYIALNTSMEYNGDQCTLIFRSRPDYSWGFLIKGLLDKIIAALIIIVTLPLWVIAAIGIKISDSKGAVFYSQMRSGLYGKPFKMWKFRSMYTDAEQRLEEVKATCGNEMEGPIFKLTNDPRIFRFGRFIRKFSIDELPQLINILAGDMSLVGPRPLPVYETEAFPSIANRRRLSVKPGLTCYWQVEDRSSSPSFNTMVEKDLKYIDNWSLWLDVKIFFRTIPAVLLGKGAK